MPTNPAITEQESEAIDELRKRLEGDIEDDLWDGNYFFLRFLRAGDFNINNTEAMIRKHLKWREQYDVKNALTYNKTEVLEKYAIYNFIGYDKDGCIIRYLPIGNTDYLGIMKSCTFEEMLKYLIHVMETDTLELKKQSERLERNVDQCIYILDYENLSFATASSKDIIYFFIIMMKLYVNNYPERLKECYALNVSMYFYLIFSVAKPLLPKTMVDRIHIYSDDSYKEDLLKAIDEDVLPAFLGGKKTDPDGNPLCPNFINHGGERVPLCYYLQKGKHLLSKEPDVKKITLSRAAFHEDNIEIKEAGSYIEWEFETKCRDIGFGLFYNEMIDGEEKITELIPLQRIDTEEYPETGTYRCDKPGKYVIVFDNTYSWVRQKEIFVKTKVLTPEEHKKELKD